MKRLVLLVTSSVLLVSGLGCAHNYPPPPPPPPPYAQAPPPLVQLAERNGFETGRADGARDVESGFAYGPRRTRAFHDCPGYDPQLGPFGAYRNAFRDAYLRGYDRGFRRG